MAHTCVRIVPIKEPLGYKSDVAESKKQEGKANTFHGLRHFCGKYAHLGAAPHGTGVVKKAGNLIPGRFEIAFVLFPFVGGASFESLFQVRGMRLRLGFANKSAVLDPRAVRGLNLQENAFFTCK